MRIQKSKTIIHNVLAIAVAGVILMLSTPRLDSAEAKRMIRVTTVDQLYLAVNNAANNGATIHLAPGTYVLSATNSEGAPRPNAGVLRLRPGMSLEGSEEHVDLNFDGVLDPLDPNDPDVFAVSGTETKIDGSGLVPPMKVRRSCGNTSSSFTEPMIAINRNNSISSLYLFGGDNIAIGEPANPIDSADSLSLNVTNTILDSFLIPLTFANSGCGRSHAHSELILTNNVVRNGGFFGLAMFNFLTGNEVNDTANGPELKATLTSNLFYNNPGTALTIRGGSVGTDGGLTTLEMKGNIFRNNGSNFFGIGGGGGRPATTRAIGNRLLITSRFDTFGEPSALAPSVLLLAGASEPLHCVLNARFFNTKFVRDSPANTEVPEILIIGADGGGDNNHVSMLLRQATVKTTTGSATFGTLIIQDETVMGSIPNSAKLIGSREDFLSLNQGFHAPAKKFFVVQ